MATIVPKVVAKGLEKEMPRILEEKIAKQKVKAEAEVLKEKHQAKYFFEKLKEIREWEAQRKSKFPMALMRKRISSSNGGSDNSDSDLS